MSPALLLRRAAAADHAGDRHSGIARFLQRAGQLPVIEDAADRAHRVGHLIATGRDIAREHLLRVAQGGGQGLYGQMIGR